MHVASCHAAAHPAVSASRRGTQSSPRHRCLLAAHTLYGADFATLSGKSDAAADNGFPTNSPPPQQQPASASDLAPARPSIDPVVRLSYGCPRASQPAFELIVHAASQAWRVWPRRSIASWLCSFDSSRESGDSLHGGSAGQSPASHKYEAVEALPPAHAGLPGACTWTGLTPATSAPGLGSPLPHLHLHWAHPCHIYTGTGLASRMPNIQKFKSRPPLHRTARARSLLGPSPRGLLCTQSRLSLSPSLWAIRTD